MKERNAQRMKKYNVLRMKNGKAQSSIEFLIFASISVLFLVAAVSFLGTRSDEVTELKRYSEMKSICESVSSRISAVFATGSGTNSTISIQDAIAGKNISVWAFANTGKVTVQDDEMSVGCPLTTNSISNGIASSFEIKKNATIRNSNGVVFIG